VAERVRLVVQGIVQGVGFRPFVYRLAREHGLKGFIRNTASGVCIEAQGDDPSELLRFRRDLALKAPPLARIESVDVFPVDVLDDPDFVIVQSKSDGAVETLVPPDIALCDDCRRELLDPSDRRYGYPFINCTNCGPRYTIVEKIPYDRPFTSMKGFAMCPDCEREYHDPMSRRFHAQPNACPVCGPRLVFLDAQGGAVDCDDPSGRALEMIRRGAIIAVKGIGGFHLAADAADDRAVELLRRRKGREEKPFAVMVRDIGSAERFCFLSPGEREALLSPEAPVVLLRRKAGRTLSEHVAPGNDRLGVMLPYSPLHVLMMERGPEALVMTSANASDEPIAFDNDEAVSRLEGIADGFLVHDRPVYLGCDDSVTVFLHGKLRQIRRGRGYVPAPVLVSGDGPQVLGVGAEIKNTVCLLKERHAIVSQHVGDLKNFEAYEHFHRVRDHLQRIFQASVELIVRDMHPSYLSSQWAEGQHSLPVLSVQHHHAHLASCLAENRCDDPAIGVVLDGTGFGTDGTVWGGEVLVGDASGASRFASFEPVPLPGGDAATAHPWKVAAGYLHHACGALPELDFLEGRDRAGVSEILDKRIGSPLTSSCGRLFDAVAAMCNLCCDSTYEGQAAIELMQAAGRLDGEPFGWETSLHDDGRLLVHHGPIVLGVLAALRSGGTVTHISRRFHVTIVELFYDIVSRASVDTGLKRVVLSGGVFQNPLVFEGLARKLEKGGFTVLTHSLVPCNDGGLSLGQAVIGREFLKGRYRGVE